jgi:hypothetical protein
MNRNRRLGDDMPSITTVYEKDLFSRLALCPKAGQCQAWLDVALPTAGDVTVALRPEQVDAVRRGERSSRHVWRIGAQHNVVKAARADRPHLPFVLREMEHRGMYRAGLR